MIRMSGVCSTTTSTAPLSIFSEDFWFFSCFRFRLLKGGKRESGGGAKGDGLGGDLWNGVESGGSHPPHFKI